jgi:hypothetical protein
MLVSSGKKRGPNKQAPWQRRPEDGVSVLRLALDAHDPVQRARVEAMFRDAYAVRRALQRDAGHRARAYGAARHERARDPAALRERLGLSRTALEHRAYAHLDAAPHLRRFVTKALAMHLADSVWTATERHLFRAVYTDAAGDFVQPRRLHAIRGDRWWSYQGPLAIVFTGLAGGALVLPVRLPTAPCNQPILDHHLADPCRWHKVDLVRSRDPTQPGGWRYEAHLLVLTTPYASPATVARRVRVADETRDRTAGVDVNVSNISVASHERGGDVRVTRIERTSTQTRRGHRRARAERIRLRALDRSRRAMNRAQYQLSRRQAKRARRREAAGLPPVDVVPMGPRLSRADGVPLQAYRRDQLSESYRRGRAAQAADAAATTQARRAQAQQTAAEVVATHGYRLVVEDGSIAAWSKAWGRAVAAFSPGLLVAVLDREARAVAAHAERRAPAGLGVERATTHTTALSQHCPCGARVPKRLADRAHHCPACGLRADRDAVAAVLASFVVFTEPGRPSSAQVDHAAAAAALPAIRRALAHSTSGWQDTLSESIGLSAREKCVLTWWTPTPDSIVVARRIAGMAPRPTLDELSLGSTTPDRARMRTRMSIRCDRRSHFRDTS